VGAGIGIGQQMSDGQAASTLSFFLILPAEYRLCSAPRDLELSERLGEQKKVDGNIHIHESGRDPSL